MSANDKKVLVIEDEVSLQRAIAEVLRMEGLSVETASDAGRGMEITRSFKPDLILLDLILPGKNGFEFLEELRQQPEFSKLPVIVLSNLGDEEDVKQGMKLGAVDFLIKVDNDLNQISKVVNKYLKK
jgi:DNA-binding response OmpR family regulator